MKKISFDQMSLSPVLLAALVKMKISQPTEIQASAVPLAIKGSDIVGVAQTGSGKTLAFALAALSLLERKPAARALVLVPTREMALQIQKVFVDLCAELPVTSVAVIGGLAGAKQENQLRKNPRLIIGTPGRLTDHLAKNKLLLQNVSIVIVDEADRMLDMGFAPQLKAVHATLRGQWQTLMFSASFGPEVEAVAKMFTRGKPVMLRATDAGSPVASLRQRVLFLLPEQKNDRLLDELNAMKGSVIVFASSQESCEGVGGMLKEYGYAVELIHGGLSQGQRNRVMHAFREGGARIVVATDLLSRGLDVAGVDHILNFELPFQAPDFLHRIGRTARAGRGGEAVTFVTPADGRMYSRIKEYLVGARETKIAAKFDFTHGESKSFARSSTPDGRKLRAGKPVVREESPQTPAMRAWLARPKAGGSGKPSASGGRPGGAVAGKSGVSTKRRPPR